MPFPEFSKCNGGEPASDFSDTLPDHTWEDILARIPLNSLGASSLVCKTWRCLTTSPTFVALCAQMHDRQSWLYVNGFKYKVTDAHTQLSPSELRSSATCPATPSSFPSAASWGPGGLCYVLSTDPSQQKKIVYNIAVLARQWSATPELKHPRTEPIVAVVKNPRTGAHTVVCAGGVPCDGTKESLKVEAFSSESQTWEECDDMPAEFRGSATSRCVAAAVCQEKLYVFHIYSGTVAAFDVQKKSWSGVKILRPPEAQYCYLAAQNGKLLLIGASYEDGKFVFDGWEVDESTMERLGAAPPRPLLCHFTGLKNAGLKKVVEGSRPPPASLINPRPPPRPAHTWALQYFLDAAMCMPKSSVAVGIKLFDVIFRRTV